MCTVSPSNLKVSDSKESSTCISEAEAALYDRQIRLWGLEAQNKLKRARILLYGMSPVGAEVAKNLVLSGVAALDIIDEQIVTPLDTASNFLIPENAIGESTVTYPTLRQSFHLGGDQPISPKSIPKGFLIMQLLRQIDSSEDDLVLDTVREKWKQVSEQLGLPENALKEEDLECCCGPLVPAVSAILGGVVAQEIIRAITSKGAPQGNWYFVDGINCSVTVEWLPETEASA
ncbi:unnamed protein product [Echinostoma caproni]|uniref:ThiF domain-containing protein n=1 Tax=Echinostoma caproni TaxID=27848 RepID=A0A183AIF5_9TREM|nr:unnamed protein product [Echinostoma caproni]